MSIAYRRDVDGLRAIAIGVVIVFHAGVPWFKGGFVGVDVFFVISGFLITSVIARELETDSFSLVSFYERRARRILPPLVTVIGAAGILAYLVLTPLDVLAMAKSALATVLFGSNVLFFRSFNYFDSAAELKPLLHTWSLAVEEQFYLLFPLLMGWTSRRLGRRGTAASVVVLALASFATSVWAMERAPLFNFFLPVTRAWELLVGSTIALGLWPRITNGSVRALLAAGGVVLIAVATMSFSDLTPFPGPAALLPVFGAAFIIHFAQGTFVERILASRAFVGVGLISYSLYLWHWPLLVFLRFWSRGAPSAANTVLAIVLTFVLATASYFFVERPWRQKSRFGRRMVFTAAALANGVVLVVAAAAILKGGPTLHGPAMSPAVANAISQSASFKADACLRKDGTLPRSADCIVGASGDAPIRVALWGDSHAAHIVPAIEAATRSLGTRAKLLTKAGCPPLIVSSFKPYSDSTATCPDFNRAVLAALEHDLKDVKVVVLAARWDRLVERRLLAIANGASDSSHATVDALSATAKELEDRGIGVIIMQGFPVPLMDPATCLRMAESNGWSAEPCDRFDARRSRRVESLFRDSVLHGVVEHEPRVKVLNVLPALCDAETCATRRENKLLFLDDSHLSVEGASLYTEQLTEALRGYL